MKRRVNLKNARITKIYCVRKGTEKKEKGNIHCTRVRRLSIEPKIRARTRSESESVGILHPETEINITSMNRKAREVIGMYRDV